MSESPRIFGVFELAQTIKLLLEEGVSGLWVEGEVASLKRAPSGHLYFSLKDEKRDAVLDCVMYRREALPHLRHLSEGARVELFGRASYYVPRGRLQFVAERARPKGQGSLAEAFERLKAKLVAEGLFDPARRRPLPASPRVVGVVTSAAGAALHDIVTVARRRGAVRIVLSPAQVQGDEAPLGLIRALDLLEGLPDLDVVIFGRGGGSAEDLAAFNDERVVRRLARVRVPVVSAVGHETDVTLSDFVADLRAATPSQAAELVVPDRRTQEEQLLRLLGALGRAERAVIARHRLALARLEKRLVDPRFVLLEYQQRLDEAVARLSRAGVRLTGGSRQRLSSLTERLMTHHPRSVVLRHRARVHVELERLAGALRGSLARQRFRFGQLTSKLDALSPLAVLGRGYSITRSLSSGRVVRHASELSVGSPVEVRVERGEFRAIVSEVRVGVESEGGFAVQSPAGPPAKGEG